MMENKVNKTLLNVRLVIGILISIAIAFSVSYAYYSFKGRVQYTITVANSTMEFNSTTLTEINSTFDLSLLSYQNTTIDGTNIGFLENTINSINLKLTKGSSSRNVSCGYEIWYKPAFTTTATSKIYLMGYEASAGNYTSAQIFAYQLPSSGANTWVKVYSSRMQESSIDLRLSYRLYDTTSSQSYTGTSLAYLGANIQLKSTGCQEDDIIYTSTKGGSSASLVASNNQNIWPTTGTSGTYILNSSGGGTITATSSNSSIVTVSYNTSTKALTVNKVGAGSAYFDLNSTAGGFTRIFLSDDFALYPNNTIDINKNYSNPMYGANSYNVTSVSIYGNETNSNLNQPLLVRSNKFSTKVTSAIGSTTTYSSVNFGYRYKGSDPNNYVWFNNERWRIIGYVPVTVGGVSTNLVEIVSDNVLGYTSYAGNFESVMSYVFKVNNNYFYAYNETTGLCGNVYIKAYLEDSNYYIRDCDSYDMVEQVDWYYGYTTSYTMSDVVSSNKANLYGYYAVGIPTIIDLAFASSDASSLATTGTVPLTNNWLAQSVSNYFLLHKTGYILLNDLESSEWSYSVRPALYLKSGVSYISGDGTYNNPYRIGLAEW